MNPHSLVGIVLLGLGATIASPLTARVQAALAPEGAQPSVLEDLLNTKVVTARRVMENVSTIPASVVLVTRDEIEQYGFTTLQEVLGNIPGLYVINNRSLEDVTLGVRGYWSPYPKNIVILVNGVTQVYDFRASYPLAKIAVPVDAIDRIEVIRGPMSVIYGNGAFFGAINIITNNRHSRSVPALATATAGSPGTQQLFLRSGGQFPEGSLTLNAAWSRNDGLDVAYADMMSNPASLSRFGLGPDARTDRNFREMEKYCNVSGKLGALSLDITHTEALKGMSLINLGPTDANQRVFRTTLMQVGYRAPVGETLTLDGRLTYTNADSDAVIQWFNKDFYGKVKDFSRAYEVELNANWTPRQDLEFTLGAFHRRQSENGQQSDMPSVGAPNSELGISGGLSKYAIYGQASWSPTPPLKVVAGLRLEQTPRYDFFYSTRLGSIDTYTLRGTADPAGIHGIPRLAVIYAPNPRHVLKLLYGQATNPSTPTDNVDVMRDNFVNSTSDPALSPEEIQTLEVNYIGTWGRAWGLNLSIFRNSLESLITRIRWLDASSFYRSRLSNAGKVTTLGTEAALTFKPCPWFHSNLSVTYQNSEDQANPDVEVACSPRLMGYWKSAFRFGNDIYASLTGTYVGRMESYYNFTARTPSDPNSPPVGRIGQPAAGHFLLGANLRVAELLNSRFFVDLHLANALNRAAHNPTLTSNPWADKGILLPGRSWVLKVGAKF